MDENQSHALEQARAHFLRGRILEAYGIFRRFFDRLPFQPEPAHATYIGMFVRTLFELGKRFELNFYLKELERLYRARPLPHLGYALGVVYAYSEESYRRALALPLFERIVVDPNAREYHAKARMMLADSVLDKDVAAARAWIEGAVPVVGDEMTRRLLEIWHSVILRREGRTVESRDRLRALLAVLGEEDTWYEAFSAKIVLAMVCLDLGEEKEAEKIAGEVRGLFEGRRLKLAETQLRVLEERLAKKRWGQPLRVVTNEEEEPVELRYGARRIRLERTQRTDRLLLLLMEKGSIDKSGIIRHLYGRAYAAERDDRLVYYHAHSLRKRLQRLGLPADCVETVGEGYRLLPDVEQEEKIA